jgi:endonuclease/exonuclease/phosphatase family metal-dependent hydrolase
MPAAFTRRGRALRSAAVVLLTAPAALALAPAVGTAHAAVTGQHVKDVTSSGFVVTVNSLGAGWHYTLWTSTNRSDMLGSPQGDHVSSRRPVLSISGLPYTSNPYWFRVIASDSSGHRQHSAIASVGLRPAVPSNVTLSNAAGTGTYLTWDSGSETGFSIERATDTGFTQGAHTYTMRGTGHQFTPSGLSRGRSYYFRVRAVNDGTLSGWSSVVQGVAQSSSATVKVLSYNILRLENDGKAEGSGHIAPWSQRRPKAVALIKQSHAAVIAIQEGAGLVTPNKRQVDDLRNALGSPWQVAYTEIPPSQPHTTRLGSYVMYRSDTYRAVGQGWHWDLGDSRTAAYQVLQQRATGAEFLFVSAHLIPNSGAKYDRERESETSSLVSQAESYAAKNGDLPIIYAGDFNSHAGRDHPLDGPGVAMRQAGVADSFLVSQQMVDAQYNSANHYWREPPRAGLSVDHVFASPGVGLQTFEIVLALRDRRFVGTIPSDHNPVLTVAAVPY